MKAYLHPDGTHSRTQAEAKANGQPFELIDIPTDHAGLIAYINGVRAAPVGLPEPGEGGRAGDFENTMTIGRPPPPGWNGQAPEYFPDKDDDAAYLAGHQWTEEQVARMRANYKNGDPTTPFMKSRDPSAIFTCTQCGHNNRNP